MDHRACNLSVIDHSFALEDRVRSRRYVFHAFALCWLVGWVFAARSWLHCHKLLHFKQALRHVGLLHLVSRSLGIDIRVGHSAGSGVRLGRIHHLFAEALIAHPE